MPTIAARNIAFFYSGSINDKLRIARTIFQQHGQRLLQDQTIVEELRGLQQEEDALGRQMQEMDMGRRCSSCAARPDGGCCSSYMAGNTDAILLLINLLLGVQIEPYNNGDECCYLGPQGCTFIIKPIFCLNYNCSHIKKAASKKEMATLEIRTGALLSRQISLEGLLLPKLSVSLTCN